MYKFKFKAAYTKIAFHFKIDCFDYLQVKVFYTPPVFFTSFSLLLVTWKPEVRDVSSTWMPDWPCFITFDLSETRVPPPEQCVVPQCSPDVWIDYLLLKTGEAWQGRSPKSEQNKESDFTDPLSIKHLRSTIARTLPTGIPPASKGKCLRDFSSLLNMGLLQISSSIVLCCNLTQIEDVSKTGAFTDMELMKHNSAEN